MPVSMFFFTDLAILKKNIESVTNALLFATNLIRPESSEEVNIYFNKVTTLNLHTVLSARRSGRYVHPHMVSSPWNAVLPAVPIHFRSLSSSPAKMVVNIFGYNQWVSRHTITKSNIGTLSFVFYLKSDNFMSFNSVLARVWQFNAGNLS